MPPLLLLLTLGGAAFVASRIYGAGGSGSDPDRPNVELVRSMLASKVATIKYRDALGGDLDPSQVPTEYTNGKTVVIVDPDESKYPTTGGVAGESMPALTWLDLVRGQGFAVLVDKGWNYAMRVPPKYLAAVPKDQTSAWTNPGANTKVYWAVLYP